MNRVAYFSNSNGKISVVNNIMSGGNFDFVVKNIYSPFNPSDYYDVFGKYVYNYKGKIIGNESIGVIEKSINNKYINYEGKYCLSLYRKTGNCIEGAYSNYSLNNHQNLIFLNENNNKNILENYNNFLINPLTVYNFLDILNNDKAFNNNKCIILTGANSSLSRFFIYKCNQQNIKTIAITRNESDNQLLQYLGASIILNSEDKDFDNNLKDCLNNCNPSYLFDCLANEIFQKIYNNINTKLTTIVYGSLSLKYITNVSSNYDYN